jgi:hypothetical protein
MISLGGSVSNAKVGVRKFVNLVKQIRNSGMSEVEVAELLKIVNGYPSSIRIENDRAREKFEFLCIEFFNRTALGHILPHFSQNKYRNRAVF